MILNNTIRLQTFDNRKLKYYESLGYNVVCDYIDVKIEHLTNGSRQIVEVECDFCNKIVFITFREYFRNTSNGNKYACCKGCGALKAKENNLLKYGVDHPMALEETQNKAKKTNLMKYGVEFLQQSKEIREKTIKNVREKWGVDHVSKSEEIRLVTSKISHDKNYIQYVSDNLSKFKCDSGFEHEFLITGDNYYHRKKNNLTLCTVCTPIGDSQSIKEKQLLNYIHSIYEGEVINSYRDEFEIDIYLPELNLGFEFNGLYWHSELWKDKWYHLNKSRFFFKKGIRIIHIWEDDWHFREDIIKSQINNWLGLTSYKIFARSCEIREVCSNTSSNFLDKNHVQGKDKSIIKLGLYFNNDLVSLMTFNKFEGRKKMVQEEWNLSRFCNKINTNVIGGAGRLLKYFEKIYKPKRIVSYSDKDWSVGDLYTKLGFAISHETNPDYKYICNGRRVHKSRFRKSRVPTLLSESKEMKRRNILKIWDCGKIKFVLNK
jgi:hypothetical protein